jgi:transposase-like protein
MTKSSSVSGGAVKQRNGRLKEQLFSVLEHNVEGVIQEGVGEYLRTGARVLLEMLMEAEANQRCGTRYERSDGRKYVRWGTDTGTAVVSGRKTVVNRPRLRLLRNMNGVGGEVPLETYRAMNRADLMDGPLIAAILSGVSTRKYAAIVSEGLKAKGVSKSAVSRKAIVATKPTVDQFVKRKLDELSLVALLFDGIHIARRQMIVCVGIDHNGRKQVLGLRLGATENEIVCRDLIADMIERGLDTQTNYLFVVDGSKALVRAIRATFGGNAAIQRCQEHKIRNVQAYVPFKYKQEIRSKLQAAYAQKTEAAAQKRLDRIRFELSVKCCQKAVDSLTEGMYETLTVHRLGVTGLLRQSLRTTNIMESLFSSVRRYMGRVTRFQDEGQVDLWVIRSIVEAERHLRRVPGYRQLSGLRKRLQSE